MTSTVCSLKEIAQSQKQKQAISVYKSMLLSRFMDEKMSKLVRQNKGTTFHLSMVGHEMIGSVCGHFLTSKKDWGFPYYRDRGFAIGLGACPVDLLGSFLARSVPNHSGGRMMPEHFSQPDLKIPCQSSCVGSQFLQAVGTALGIKLQGKDEVVYVSAGDGATSQGDFHEALNFASIHALPILFVIHDNGWAISVPSHEQTAGGACEKFGRGYDGLNTISVNGCDYPSFSASVSSSIARARKGEGPSLIVAKVPRIGPHSSSDDPKKYKTQSQCAQDLERDPVTTMESYLIQENYLSKDKIEKIREEVSEQIEKASQQAEKIPFPIKESATTKLFKEVDLPIKESNPKEPVVMMDALNHALQEEMERDEGVVVFGQDVAHGKGGVFGITRSLTQTFGEKRCFNTPLAESTIVGIATGLSFNGFHKPVAEIQFADYSWTGMNQLMNELASIYYRSNGQWNCPVVIRMPYGGYIQGGPYHSQSIEAFLCHCPGLKVVIPSNAADAKRLLKSAIRDPNPVIFLEHKALYRQRSFCATAEPSAEELLPFGKANLLKEGDDLTMITWGMISMMGAQLAEMLKKEGITIDLIDLRTLSPLDKDTIYTSVKKTGKVLIAHEAVKTCGFGAELAAMLSEELFSYLDAPICRIGAKHCVVPFCKDLEEVVLPQMEDLKQAAIKLAAH